jgi:hypothetical protein
MEWIKKQGRILERQDQNSSQRMEAGMQGIGNLLMPPNTGGRLFAVRICKVVYYALMFRRLGCKKWCGIFSYQIKRASQL